MNQMNGNNNRRPSNINRIQMVENNKPSTNTQHEELIKYILDSWNRVSQEADRNAVIYYHEEHQNLKDFKPFDLEGYWGRRLQNRMQQHAQHS